MQDRKKDDIQTRKEDRKLFLFTNDIIAYIEYPKE